MDIRTEVEPRLILGGAAWLFADGTVLPVISGGADDDDADAKDDDKSGDDDAKGDDKPDDDKAKDDADDADSKDDDKRDAELTKVRKEAAKRRVEAKESKQKADKLEATITALKKAIGVEDDDDDAEAISKKLAAKEAELRSVKVENALVKAAKKHSADAEALVDSRSFMKQAEDLDPDDKDFATDLASLVEEAVTKNPKLKAAQAADKSGAEFKGGSGTKKSFTRAEIAAMSQEERSKRMPEIEAALAAGAVTT